MHLQSIESHAIPHDQSMAHQHDYMNMYDGTLTQLYHWSGFGAMDVAVQAWSPYSPATLSTSFLFGNFKSLLHVYFRRSLRKLSCSMAKQQHLLRNDKNCTAHWLQGGMHGMMKLYLGISLCPGQAILVPDNNLCHTAQVLWQVQL